MDRWMDHLHRRGVRIDYDPRRSVFLISNLESRQQRKSLKLSLSKLERLPASFSFGGGESSEGGRGGGTRLNRILRASKAENNFYVTTVFFRFGFSYLFFNNARNPPFPSNIFLRLFFYFVATAARKIL